MRNYLKNLNIVGALNVWAEGEIIRYAIESLLFHCNILCITMDYSDKRTKDIVTYYQCKYLNRIFTNTTEHRLPPPNKEPFIDKERGVKWRIMRRQKDNIGLIKQAAFDLVLEQHKKKPIDLLYFMDSDEMLTVHAGKTIEEFWESEVDTLFIRPIECWDDITVICSQGLISHARIYKYKPEITSIPHSKQDYYLPYRKKRNIWKKPYNYVHLARLTKENQKLREELRGVRNFDNVKLRRVNKPAYELTYQEAHDLLKNDNFIRIKDFEQKYNCDINKVPLTNVN